MIRSTSPMKTGKELTVWSSKGFGETLIEVFQYLKKVNKNNTKISFTKASRYITRGNSFKLKKTDSGRIYKEDIVYNEGSEKLKLISQ